MDCERSIGYGSSAPSVPSGSPGVLTDGATYDELIVLGRERTKIIRDNLGARLSGNALSEALAAAWAIGAMDGAAVTRELQKGSE